MPDTRAPFFHASKIWAICEKHGSENTDWGGLARQGKLTHFISASIILAWTTKKWDEFECQIKAFIPLFKLNSLPGKEEKKDSCEPSSIPVNPIPGTPNTTQEEKPQSKFKKYSPRNEDYIKPSCFDEFTAMVENKMQVCLVGPSGLGKSRMVREAAKCLDLECSVFTFGGGLRFQHLFYTVELKDGNTFVRLMPFLESIQKPGIVCIDEIMGGDEDIVLGLNSITELSQRYVMTPLGKIEVHKDCVIIGTSNTNGREISEMYTGTKRQDESILNRFIQFPMDYDEAVESKIIGHLNTAQIDYLIARLQIMRKKSRENQLSRDFSTRGLIQAGKLISSGFSQERAFWLIFLAPLSLSERISVGEIS